MNATRLTEVHTVDAMGNQAESTTWRNGNGTPPTSRNAYSPGRGRITSIGRILSAQPGETPKPDSTYRHYDGAGNVTWGEYKGWGEYFNGAVGINHITLTRNYYAADGRLRVVQVHDETTTGSSWKQNGSYAEYRYDPLGRRIMERTRRDSVCFSTSHDCESTLTRFVWAGDQLLWELRVPGGNEVVGSGLESTSASGDFYGRVSYFHAGGIDRPLLITKEGVESVVPRETWRGQFHKGTSPATGLVRDCTYGGQTGCLLIAWPGMQTNAAHSWGGEQPDIRVWYGGLVDGMRDASGQMYMRNRYYDPATGQFTQTDPIGIAGGLNAYGFAGGDPVSYSDPYGLCPEIPDTTAPCSFFAVVMGEARGASQAFQIGVANVIRNRSTAVGGDYERVIWAPGQFDAMSPEDPNNSVVQDVLFNGTVTQQVRDVVEGVYTGQIGDNTSGALLYYSPQSMKPVGRKPGWNFGQLDQTLDLGNEGKFYKCKSGTSCWQRPPASKPIPRSSGGYPVPKEEK